MCASLVAIPTANAAAAPAPPTGALRCDTKGELKLSRAIPLLPSGAARSAKVSTKDAAGRCDASAVQGGRATIDNVKVTLSATVPADANCQAMAVDALTTKKPKVKLRLLDARKKTVATITPTNVVLKIDARAGKVIVTGKAPNDPKTLRTEAGENSANVGDRGVL